MSCIVCDTNVPSELEQSNSCREVPRLRQMKKTFEKFCSYFNLPLGSVQWDFSKETFPFCPQCNQDYVRKLVEPLQLLNSNEEELLDTEHQIKSRISKINSSCSLKVKGWKNKDPRVETLRDLIVGPCLKLKRLPSPPSEFDEEITIKEEVVDPDDECSQYEDIDQHNSMFSAPLEPPDDILLKKKATIAPVGANEVYRDEKMTVDIIFDDSDTSDCTLSSDDDDDDSSGLSEDDNPLDEDYIPNDTDDTTTKKNKPKRKRKPRVRKDKNGIGCSSKSRISSNSLGKRLTILGDDNYIYHEKFKFSGNEQDGFKCGECNSTNVYRPRENIFRHLRRVHLRVPKKHNPDDDSLPPVFKCSVCGKIVTTARSLRHHMEYHDDKFAFICEHCGKVCRGRLALQGHLRRVHLVNNKLACDQCDKVFKAQKELTQHTRAVHMKEKNVFCEFCGRGFYKGNQLKNHINSVHLKARLFCCDHCEQAYSQKAPLIRHVQRFHADLQLGDQQTQPEVWKKLNLPCKYCCMRYSRHNDLTMHLKRVHNINVKGLNWKSKPPRKILESVTLEPELVVQNVSNYRNAGVDQYPKVEASEV